jgi:hypothetical protein
VPSTEVVPPRWSPFGLIAHGTQKITTGGGEDLDGKRLIRGYDNRSRIKQEGERTIRIIIDIMDGNP